MDIFTAAPIEYRILAEVALATVLGACIGLDRELANKPAGLRTHILVTGGAALFVALGTLMVEQFTGRLGEQVLQADPVRIIEAVLTGIAFLGAGTIIHHRESGVEGLTTAASILFAAAVGVSVALDRLLLSIGLTVLVLIILRGLYHFECRLHPRRENVGQQEE